MFSWFGLGQQVGPRPKPLPGAFTYTLRGLLVGVPLGGLLVALWFLATLAAAPYCP